MIEAYKQHFQFIMILTVMYVSGVWGGLIIYPMFPLVVLLFGIRQRYFEMFITSLWLLMLSDYVPIKNATYDDLQFAKDLKVLIPIFLLLFYLKDREEFMPIPKVTLYFLPFLAVMIFSLSYSMNLTVGYQKTLSFALMYFCIPIYVAKLHRDHGEDFWKALITFIIGMLMIGIILGFVAPNIGLMSDNRFKGVLGNPNGLGVFLNLTFILWVVVEEFELARFTKAERILIIFVILFSLLWCGSRNGMMSIFLFYVMYRFIKINWFLGLVFVISLLVFEDLLFESFLGIVEFFNLTEYFRVDSIEEGSGRKIAWYFVWGEILRDNFFIGGGFGHDENVMRQNYWWLELAGHNGGVHNSYLSLWMNGGLVGVIMYFTAFLILVFRSVRHNYIVLAFAASMLFNITYESWLVASLNPFTILFLTILTTFESRLSSTDYTVEPEPVRS
jgi:hypothetical protein